MKSTNKSKNTESVYTSTVKSRGIATQNLVITALMAAIMCILGPLSLPLPFTPVPISLINFAIYITAFVLSCKYCTLSYIVYILIGAIGLPVFSSFGAGIDKIVGPTGGYIIGLIFTAFICSIVNEKFAGKVYMYVIGMIVGLAVAYIFGTLWFMYQQGMGFRQSLVLCVIPFLIGDAVKIGMAAIIGPVLKKTVVRIR